MADLKITQLTALVTASVDDIFPVVDDPAGLPVTKKITLANLMNSLGMVDGWITANEAWTTASTTTITVPTDATTKYSIGDKIRLKQGGAYKYFYIVGVAATTLTITGGSSYTLTHPAAITDNYYSKVSTPVGFPQWLAYSPTVGGFAVNPTATYRFCLNGRLCTVVCNITAYGTSNSTGYTVSAPVTAGASGAATKLIDAAADNGSAINLGGFVTIANGGSVFSLFKDYTAGGWTAAGNKGAYFMIGYEV